MRTSCSKNKCSCFFFFSLSLFYFIFFQKEVTEPFCSLRASRSKSSSAASHTEGRIIARVALHEASKPKPPARPSPLNLLVPMLSTPRGQGQILGTLDPWTRSFPVHGGNSDTWLSWRCVYGHLAGLYLQPNPNLSGFICAKMHFLSGSQPSLHLT